MSEFPCHLYYCMEGQVVGLQDHRTSRTVRQRLKHNLFGSPKQGQCTAPHRHSLGLRVQRCSVSSYPTVSRGAGHPSSCISTQKMCPLDTTDCSLHGLWRSAEVRGSDAHRLAGTSSLPWQGGTGQMTESLLCSVWQKPDGQK